MWSCSTEIKSYERDSDVLAGCWISTTGTGSTFHCFGSSLPCASSLELMMDPPFRFTFNPHGFHPERLHVTFLLQHASHNAFPFSWTQGSPWDMQAPQGPFRIPPAFPCSENLLTTVFLLFLDQPYIHGRGGWTTYI